MAVGLDEPAEVYNIEGVRLSVASAGIRYKDRNDITLIEVSDHSTVAAVFTQNKFRAAPVDLACKHLQAATPRYLIINAGNANAGTGQPGVDAAVQTTLAVAKQTNVNSEQVLPFSTGVIGEILDVEKIESQLPLLIKDLSESHWLQAAKAIMTTDTVSKAYSKKIQIGGSNIHITGIAKGSGMIQPNMATMLSYIATDLAIQQESLQSILVSSTDKSFNSITVDSDTSTNDACVLIATGKSSVKYENLTDAEQSDFANALCRVMQMLAQSIVRDGEGASKFVTIKITQAMNAEQAKLVAYSVANSPLVKTALAASDPNWGRIMAAAGKCNDEQLQLAHANLLINDISVMEKGEIATTYSEDAGKKAMASDEIVISIELGLGNAESTVWTTDLTHEYIRINAEYRS